MYIADQYTVWWQDERINSTVSLFPQYLPIYTPSNEEKENPALFASNVRKLMAK